MARLHGGRAGLATAPERALNRRPRSDATMAPGWPLSRPCGAGPTTVQATRDGGVAVVWNAGPKPYFGTLAIRYRADGSEFGP
jgi:hypothetical protein